VLSQVRFPRQPAPGVDAAMAQRETTIRTLRFLGRALVRALRVSFLLFVIALAAGTWAYFWLQANVLSSLPNDLSSFRSYRPPTACRVYAQDGSILDQFYIERRIWVPLADLPPHVWQAFIAAEDRRFLDHPGVDVWGIVRAFVRNVESGTISEGGSTITQQLVKNLIVGKQRSYKRKMAEAVLAVRLENQLSKMEILELYVNYVALGSGNYGVEAASQDYFGVSARDLDASQAAMLAGLVPAPSRYSPRVNPEAARQRRSLVLDTMVDAGFLATHAAHLAEDEPLLVPHEAGMHRAAAAAYATEVRREVRRVVGADIPFKAGLQVFTPMNPDVQQATEAAVRAAVEALQEREGRQGAIAHVEPGDLDAFLKRAPGLARDPITFEVRPPNKGDCFSAAVGKSGRPDDLLAGDAAYVLDKADWELRVRATSDKEHAGPLKQKIQAGDVLRVCYTGGRAVHMDPRPWGEGAAVVLENATGRVIALAGGYATTIEGFVRATQARRQPGSSFKAYVYAAALLHGHNQLDRVLDGPIVLPAGGGHYWSPRNYSGSYAGWVPMRHALAQSLNTVSVRLTLEQGAAEVARVARAMGVRTPLRRDPTIALGSSEITPMDQALGYATIARLGVPIEPVLVDRLVDVFGRQVGTAGSSITVGDDFLGQLPGAPGPRALPGGVAYELADMLREVVHSGTAHKAWRTGYDRAGKTGTSNAFQDAWFVGFTPRYTVAVWIGTDGTATLGDQETGGRAALPAWLSIMASLPEVEGERLPVPDDALIVASSEGWIGIPSGQAPASALPLPHLGDEPLPEVGALAASVPGRPSARAPSRDETLYGLPD
jgi:penicillin-binding protein 1A